jgi:hypothetical protein
MLPYLFVISVPKGIANSDKYNNDNKAMLRVIVERLS